MTNHWELIKSKLFRERTLSAPPGFADRVMNQIKAENRTRTSWSLWLPALGLSTALLLISFIPQSPVVDVDELLTTYENNTPAESFLDYPNGGQV